MIVPSRPAWFVNCTEHPHLGKSSDGEPWGYATSGRAHGVATRHRQDFHEGKPDKLAEAHLGAGR